MADYLEYYNTNLSIRYPFVGTSNDNSTLPIANNWFADIIFYSFDPDIKAAYLSELIISPSDGSVTLIFSDPISNALELGATFLISQIVDNTQPGNPSFLGVTTDNAALKVVFGPGFLSLLAASIDQYYTPDQSTLASSAFVPCVPKVRTLDFLNYYPYESIEVYDNGNPNVNLQFDANTIGTLINDKLVIDVNPGSGAGLFNGCADIFPTADLYSINSQIPNSQGNLYLVPSPCYSMKLLDTSDLITYGSTLTSQYDPFSIPYQTPDIFNALIPYHSFLFINNCSAKCAPENLNAFAQYVNRIYNGVQELVYYVDSPNQTTGTGSSTTSAGVTSFTASSFASTYPSETGFIKYFHEGKNIYYQASSGAISYTNQIATVISPSEITFVTTLSADITNYLFQVDDLGVFQKINDTIVNYNTNIAPLVQAPNGAINYTTYDGTDAYGNNVTFLAIVCSVYNPTTSSMTFTVPTPTLTGSISLVPGSQQIQYNGSTYDEVPVNFTVACKKYANYNVVYEVPCGGNTASVLFAITENWESISGGLLPITSGSSTVPVTSTGCPPVVTSSTTVNTINGATFDYRITTAAGSGTIVFNSSSLPSWASTHTTYPTSGSTYNIYGTVSESAAVTYAVDMAVIDSGGGILPFVLYINVLTVPVLSPTNQTATVGVPFIYSIPATNSPTAYTATGLPSGLHVNTTTGAIYGVSTTTGSSTVSVSASVTVGSTTLTGYGSFTIAVSQSAPVINSSLTSTATHGTSYSYQITATNSPTSFSATSLPSGLYCNTAGLIYGIPSTTSGSPFSIGINATNSAGTGSNTLVLTVS